MKTSRCYCRNAGSVRASGSTSRATSRISGRGAPGERRTTHARRPRGDRRMRLQSFPRMPVCHVTASARFRSFIAARRSADGRKSRGIRSGFWPPMRSISRPSWLPIAGATFPAASSSSARRLCRSQKAAGLIRKRPWQYHVHFWQILLQKSVIVVARLLPRFYGAAFLQPPPELVLRTARATKPKATKLEVRLRWASSISTRLRSRRDWSNASVPTSARATSRAPS